MKKRSLFIFYSCFVKPYHSRQLLNLPQPGVFILIASVMFLVMHSASYCYAIQKKKYDIVMITWRSETPAEQGFKEFLAKKGYQIIYHMYNAGQDMVKLHSIINNIKGKKSDLVYVFGTTATREVLLSIPDIPVVFNVVTRPVEAGIIKSWEDSGNNSTGVSSMVPISSQLKAFKKVVDYKLLAMLYNPLEPNSLIQRDVIKSLTRELDFQLMEFHITHTRDVERVISDIKGRVDAVYLPSDSKIISLGSRIMNLVNRFKIPSFAAVESMVVNDDALIGLIPDYYDLGTLAASKAILILNGKRPCEIPCSTLKFFNIAINMKTARKIEIQIPTSLLIISDTIVR